MSRARTGPDELPDAIRNFLTSEVRDLLAAEKELVKSLPLMAQGASSDELRAAFRKHLEETTPLVERLNDLFNSLDRTNAEGGPVPPETPFTSIPDIERDEAAGPLSTEDEAESISLDEVLNKTLETFGDAEAANAWLEEFCPALHGVPIAVSEKPDQRRAVLDVLACIDHGMIY